MKLDYGNIIAVVRAKRQLAWERIRSRSRLFDQYHPAASPSELLRRVCVLASSSRGGSSVTAEMLQWQGSDCSSPKGKMLSLPGEEKPMLILAGFAFPARRERFDDLTELDAGNASNVGVLMSEMVSEVGVPAAICNDMELYALQLYRRLLLQWPVHLVHFEPDIAVTKIKEALLNAFPHGYLDSPRSRQDVLAAIADSFPFVRKSLYDCWPAHIPGKTAPGPENDWHIEETPFILPPPWQNATHDDWTQGLLLLRDPSNAWRLPFWRVVFGKQKIEVLHLIRDPRESIQGLCDGWNYPLGFQTMPSGRRLSIVGYTDSRCGSGVDWKGHSLNFSISESLSRSLLTNREVISLVGICSRQWLESHSAILFECARLRLPRISVSFTELRDSPESTFRHVCDSFGLEVSKSGLAFAQAFAERWVMATTTSGRLARDRWKDSPFAEEILQVTSSSDFVALSTRLGIPPFLTERAPREALLQAEEESISPPTMFELNHA